MGATPGARSSVPKAQPYAIRVETKRVERARRNPGCMSNNTQKPQRGGPEGKEALRSIGSNPNVSFVHLGSMPLLDSRTKRNPVVPLWTTAGATPRQASLNHEKHETHEKRDAGWKRQVGWTAASNDCHLTFVCFVCFVVCSSVFLSFNYGRA